MLQEALCQQDKRLSESANMFKDLSLLNPKKIRSQTLRGKFEDLPFPHFIESKRIVEVQYRKVYLVEWCEVECFAERGIPADSIKFRQGVAKYNNFKDRATYALTCFIAPASNAIVERIFYILVYILVTVIKIKPYNKTFIVVCGPCTDHIL